MPTGYTAEIYEGKKVSFERFAMKCARAFGACVTMRDDDMDAEIPNKFKASDYHDKELARAKKRLDDALTITPKQAAGRAVAQYDKLFKAHQEDVAEKLALKERYESLLVQVRSWVPPTNKHREFRKFMADQLEQSIEFDCSPNDPPKVKTPEEWRADEIERAKWNVNYHAKEGQAERIRVAERNAWIRALRDSLYPAMRAERRGKK